jgi:hypothetical protein
MNIELYDEEKISIFYNIIILIKKSTLTISFDMTNERLFIQGMDSSKITLHEITLYPSWFDVFTLDSTELISSCSTILLDKIFSTYKSGQTFKIYTNDENKVNIEFIGDTNGSFNKYFQIGTIEIEQDYKEIPKDIDYDCTFTIDSRILIDTMNQLLKFGEILEIRYGINGICFISSDDLDNKFSVEIKSSSTMSILLSTILKISTGAGGGGGGGGVVRLVTSMSSSSARASRAPRSIKPPS